MQALIAGMKLQRRLTWIAFAAFLVSLSLLSSRYLDLKVATRSVAPQVAFTTRPRYHSALDKILNALYNVQLHSITAENFTDESGQVFRIPEESFYKQSLGQRVLILDADTRPMNKKGELLDSDGMKWPKLEPMSAGILGHYLYSRIHGYNYRFVRAKPISNWSMTWSKVPEIKSGLMTHDVVVFLDQDAVFRYPTLPLEWLLNHWQHDNETSLMLAFDPDKEFNTDGHKNLYMNTGFVIAQNLSRTHDLIDSWLRCPTGAEYEDCKRFAYDWPHEQAALISFVKKYEFTRTSDVRAIPCNEANGSPWTADQHGCRGALVRHLWKEGKGRQAEEFVNQVMQYMTPALYNDFREEYDQVLATTPSVEEVLTGEATDQDVNTG